MGSSCCGKNDTCPTHPGSSFNKICVCDSCLEPLCSECVRQHIILHEKLGYPHKIEKYSSVEKQYKRKTKFDYQDKNALIQNTTPTSLIIKQYTKEYFENNQSISRNDAETARILGQLEIWKEMHEDPNFTRKFNNFLRDNLRANKAIVGDKFQHLY